MEQSTTIRLEKSLKAELDELKNTRKESYAEVVERLVQLAQDEASLSRDEIRQLNRSLKDLKAGRVMTLDDAEKKWGI